MLAEPLAPTPAARGGESRGRCRPPAADAAPPPRLERRPDAAHPPASRHAGLRRSRQRARRRGHRRPRAAGGRGGADHRAARPLPDRPPFGLTFGGEQSGTLTLAIAPDGSVLGRLDEVAGLPIEPSVEGGPPERRRTSANGRSARRRFGSTRRPCSASMASTSSRSSASGSPSSASSRRSCRPSSSAAWPPLPSRSPPAGSTPGARSSRSAPPSTVGRAPCGASAISPPTPATSCARP